MGVNLTDLVQSARPVGFQDLAGKNIAIDAFNTMYQFLSIIRDRMTGEPLRDSRGQVTSHLSGILYRTTRMIESGIEPVYVFDGKPPEFKRKTTDERRKIREEAMKKWQEAVEKKDYEAVRRYSQQASKLTDDMIKEAKKLLDAMGIPWVQAPCEGEAQAAHMVRKGLSWSTASQDWDSLMFGSTRFVRNLTITGKRKVPRKEKYIEIVPELVELDAVLDGLGISQDQLIVLGMLVGTDFNPGGIKGIGPKKALDLVRQYKDMDSAISHVNWEFDNPPEQVFDFFRNPPVDEINADDVKQGKMDAEKLKKLMHDDHDFSEERVDSAISKLKKASVGTGQSKLASFLGG